MVKNLPTNTGDEGWIPGLGRSPGVGNGNPLQYSCLENPHGQRRLAGYCPWGHKESDTTEQLNKNRSSRFRVNTKERLKKHLLMWNLILGEVSYTLPWVCFQADSFYVVLKFTNDGRASPKVSNTMKKQPLLMV